MNRTWARPGWSDSDWSVGGREIHLRTLQPLALQLAKSIFLGDYLSSEGQAGSADLQMVADGWFVVEGHEEELSLPPLQRTVAVGC